jgi:hypothetical protein
MDEIPRRQLGGERCQQASHEIERYFHSTCRDSIIAAGESGIVRKTELHHLTHLRDSLLPMLMNGQVTIEENGK